MGGKWIQLLKEVAPRTRRIAVIYNPETSSNELFLPGMRVSADALGIEVTVARVHGGGFASVTAIAQAVGSIAQAGDAGLVFPPDSYSILTNGRIVQIAAQYRVPAVYGFGEFVQRGGLISYGVNLSAQYSEAATSMPNRGVNLSAQYSEAATSMPNRHLSFSHCAILIVF
jgi:putative ABC transport system substrate-binding protein